MQQLEQVITSARDKFFCPELKLLLHYLQAFLHRNPVNFPTISTRQQQRLVTLIQHHKVTPLMYHVLQHSQYVPETLLAQLKSLCRANSYRILQLTAQLLAVNDLLQHAGIKSIALKGPLLAKKLYNDITMRESGDLDIVVAYADIPRADKLLVEKGYMRIMPKVNLSAKQYAFYLKYRKDFTYYHPKTAVYLDLHWRYFDNSQLCNPTWQNLQSHQLGSTIIKSLGEEDELVYLMLHGSLHAWSNLNWLCDITQRILHSPALNWNKILAYCYQQGIQRYILESMVLAQQLLKCPMPLTLISLCQQDKNLPAMTTATINLMAHNRSAFTSKLLKLKRELKLNQPATAFWLITNFGMLPADWEVFSLPDKLFFLYHIFRPFFWLYRKVNFLLRKEY